MNECIYHFEDMLTSIMTIDFISTEEGRVKNSSGAWNYEYNLKDHLGNTRVSFDSNSGTARIIQEDEYYSFGLRKPTGGYDFSSNNRYLYNGKEVQTDLANQYDYGARFYDPVIARWTSVDPMAKDFDYVSPYNYGMNNPILMIDPDGMAADSTSNPKRPPSSTVTTGAIPISGILLNQVTVVGNTIAKFVSRSVPIVSAGYAGWSLGSSIAKNIDGFSLGLAQILEKMGVPHEAMYGPKPPMLNSKSEDANDLELPTIDNTGKVHGELPDPNDMKKFPKDKLKQFLRDLKKSVQQRQN